MKAVELQLYLTMFAVLSLCSNAAGYTPYSFVPPRLPKPDFQFTFYMQSRVGSPTNSTVYAVTLPIGRVDDLTLTNQTWLLQSNTSFFGTIGVFENPLTLEAPSNSTQVGFGRGMFVFDNNFGSDEPVTSVGSNGVEWLWTGIFNDESGLGNSTLCFKGWNLELDSVTGTAELTLCGGTGLFKLARGYVQISAVVGATSASLRHDVSVFIKA
ncbi:hypothetical protein R1flu_004120 [Riccia fluitans]|uniref:Dirigent protein n=1 Tax=Riccia fluitans TaxID=41844 RepID=A0ABD1YPD5_9MARC